MPPIEPIAPKKGGIVLPLPTGELAHRSAFEIVTEIGFKMSQEEVCESRSYSLWVLSETIASSHAAMARCSSNSHVSSEKALARTAAPCMRKSI